MSQLNFTIAWPFVLRVVHGLRNRSPNKTEVTVPLPYCSKEHFATNSIHSNRKGLQPSTKIHCTLNLYHFFSWKQFNGNNYWQTILSNLSQKSIAIQTLMVSTEYDDRIVGLHENKPISWRLSLSTPLDQPLLTHVIIKVAQYWEQNKSRFYWLTKLTKVKMDQKSESGFFGSLRSHVKKTITDPSTLNKEEERAPAYGNRGGCPIITDN